MSKKRFKRRIYINFVLTFVIIAVLVTMAQMSFGVDVFKSARNTKSNIADKDKAYVGISHEDFYTIMDSEDTIPITITNNLQYRVSYQVNLSGALIKEFSPHSFSLNPGESCTIEVSVLTDEEYLDDVFLVTGNISALFAKGNADVDLSFSVDVEPPTT